MPDLRLFIDHCFVGGRFDAESEQYFAQYPEPVVLLGVSKNPLYSNGAANDVYSTEDITELHRSVSLLLERGNDAALFLRQGSIGLDYNVLCLPVFINKKKGVLCIAGKRGPEVSHSQRENRQEKATTILVSSITSSILSCDQAFERMTGFSAEDAIGRYVADLGIFPAAAQFKKHLENVLRNGHDIILKTELRRKDGTTFSVRIASQLQGNSPGVSVVIRSLTDESIPTPSKSNSNGRADILERLVVFDEGGRVLTIDSHTADVFGKPIPSIMGRSIAELCTNGYAESVREHFRTARMEKVNFRFDFHKDPKSTVEIRAAIRPSLDETGRGGMCGFIDDEAKPAEKSTEDLFETIFRENGVAIVLFDDNLTIAFANDEAIRLVGKPREELSGHKWMELLFPEDLDKVKEIHRLRSENPDAAPSGYEVKMQTGNGVRHIRIQARYLPETRQTVVSLVDVTEQKQIEKTLETNREQFRLLFENSSLGIVIADMDGTIEVVNPALTDFLGYSQDELRNLAVDELSYPFDRENELSLRGELLAGKRNSYQIEKRYLAKSGAVKWGYLTVSAFRDDTGAVQSVFAVIEDISDKKEKETHLRQNEEKYRTLFRVLPDAFLIVEMDSRLIVEANESANKIFAAKSSELRGVPLTQLFPRLEFDAQLFERAINEEVYRLPVHRATRLDGETFPVEVNAGVFDLEGKKVLCCTVRDITEWLNARDALKQSASLLRAVLETLPLGVCVVDKERRMLLSNPASKIIHESLVLDGLEDPEPTEDGEGLPSYIDTGDSIDDALNSGYSTLHRDVELRDSHGQVRSFQQSTVPIRDQDGEVTGAIVVLNDITDKRKSDQRLHEFSQALEQSPTLVLITNTDGIIEYVNKKFVETTGYQKQEVIGHNPSILKSGLTSSEVYAELWETLKEGNIWRGELLNRKKNGELYWQLSSISPLRNTKGETTHFLSMMEDITGRKRTEQELLRAKEKAEQADKLKDSFLANISHEIRTPLNIIIGYNSLLSNALEGHLETDQKTYLSSIERAGKRLMRTVEQVLNISSIQAGSFPITKETFDIGEEVEELITEYRQIAAEKNIEINVVHDAASATVHADKYSINQALANILDNALKFTSKGKVDIRIYLKNHMTCVSIEDTGIGMSEHYVPRAFDLFSQEVSGYTRPYEGLGIGMALTKRYIDANGGTVLIDSVKGSGTTITLAFDSFRRHEQKESAIAEPAIPDAPEAQDPTSDRSTILVVEDDDLNQEYVRVLLQKTHKVLTASSAKDAWTVLEHNHVDLVLMDLSLRGDEDGLQCTRRIRGNDRFKKLPVIALTAHAYPEDKQKCIDAGCNGYLAKPFSVKDLLEMLTVYLQEVK